MVVVPPARVAGDAENIAVSPQPGVVFRLVVLLSAGVLGSVVDHQELFESEILLQRESLVGDRGRRAGAVGETVDLEGHLDGGVAHDVGGVRRPRAHAVGAARVAHPADRRIANPGGAELGRERVDLGAVPVADRAESKRGAARAGLTVRLDPGSENQRVALDVILVGAGGIGSGREPAVDLGSRIGQGREPGRLGGGEVEPVLGDHPGPVLVEGREAVLDLVGAQRVVVEDLVKGGLGLVEARARPVAVTHHRILPGSELQGHGRGIVEQDEQVRRRGVGAQEIAVVGPGGLAGERDQHREAGNDPADDEQLPAEGVGCRHGASPF